MLVSAFTPTFRKFNCQSPTLPFPPTRRLFLWILLQKPSD
jgi:hypothetical protein